MKHRKKKRSRDQLKCREARKRILKEGKAQKLISLEERRYAVKAEHAKKKKKRRGRGGNRKGRLPKNEGSRKERVLSIAARR